MQEYWERQPFLIHARPGLLAEPSQMLSVDSVLAGRDYVFEANSGKQVKMYHGGFYRLQKMCPEASHADPETHESWSQWKVARSAGVR